MNSAFIEYLKKNIQELKEGGLYKSERVIASKQSGSVKVADGKEVINLCSNNYLGLASDPEVAESAKAGIETYGFGLSSVRFICGTQTIHKDLESKLSQFLGTDDTILYSSCFDANGGLFETLLSQEDAIISDELNHASIIDGIRLCKAQRFRYKNNDMHDLEAKLKEASGARFKMIATDGVFSMDGTLANLPAICDLAEKYNALVMVDDSHAPPPSHAVGFMGKEGRGTHEHFNVMDRIDIITGTLGKALGGASGGYTSGRKEIIEWLRQRSRPYLFSNTLAPPIAAASISVLKIVTERSALRKTLHDNTRYFRENLEKLGFSIIPGEHPIIPVMLGDAKLAKEFADKMLAHGIYVVGFSYPVVPMNKARIRTQMSAGLTKEHLDKALSAFRDVGRELHVIR
ncbi:glycine C-acetyltransferase [Estrella lausannensis]|uniref:2-amino-3-ketobutyrate coenzyme A ligase n=1 Tax=Estrella lausannensis TaxID=483423 RepID=A0A0H5DP38_9BACT|nr:glycine C-acetyltransferase [Estrella lausannensis]CRX38112.1 2-amino-3-ketobutyrate coenzyme A ligase [Estrella lausannensis]